MADVVLPVQLCVPCSRGQHTCCNLFYPAPDHGNTECMCAQCRPAQYEGWRRSILNGFTRVPTIPYTGLPFPVPTHETGMSDLASFADADNETATTGSEEFINKVDMGGA
jgi:hypothetical protein